MRRRAVCVYYASRMLIPKFEVEPRKQVQARVPVSQVAELKALALSSGVPVSRAVHYAIERLLAAAREGGSGALRTGMAEPDSGAPPGDALAVAAGALGCDAADPPEAEVSGGGPAASTSVLLRRRNVAGRVRSDHLGTSCG